MPGSCELQERRPKFDRRIYGSDAYGNECRLHIQRGSSQSAPNKVPTPRTPRIAKTVKPFNTRRTSRVITQKKRGRGIVRPRLIIALAALAVCSLASVFVSRWDKATMAMVPAELRDKLGIAVAKRTYKTYRQLLDSDRWLRLANAGARPQRRSGLARVQRTRQLQAFSTASRWPRHSRSTRFLTRPYLPSALTGNRRYEPVDSHAEGQPLGFSQPIPGSIYGHPPHPPELDRKRGELGKLGGRLTQWAGSDLGRM